MVPDDRISLVHRILTLPDLMITLSFKEDIIGEARMSIIHTDIDIR